MKVYNPVNNTGTHWNFEVEIRLASLDEFKELKNDWQNLLKNSSADPLFLSWHWQYRWWLQFSDSGNDKLYLVLAFLENQLAGIAPLYVHTNRLFGLIPKRSLHLIGTRHKGHGGFRAENLGLIVKNDDQNITTKLVQYVNSTIKAAEIIFSDLVTKDHFYQQLKNCKGYVRTKTTGNTYVCDTSNTYENYLSTLGKNSRLRLHNRRKLLETLGEISISDVTDDNLDETFDTLEKLQSTRWNIGKGKLQSRKLFVKALAEDGTIHFSGLLLKLNKTNIGCIFDLIIGDKAYNLQLTYKENISKKLSIGLITLGYKIEEYCESNIKTLDLLEGQGKNSNYKTHLARKDKELASLHIVKNPFLKLAYRLRDALK